MSCRWSRPRRRCCAASTRTSFKAEKADTWNGKPARLLTFTVPMTKLPEQQRKYVKEFDATVSIWIAADGTPLASATHTTVKGRAFVVVSFEAVDDDSHTYGVVGDRLLTLRSEKHNTSSGAGESRRAARGEDAAAAGLIATRPTRPRPALAAGPLAGAARPACALPLSRLSVSGSAQRVGPGPGQRRRLACGRRVCASNASLPRSLATWSALTAGAALPHSLRT